METSALGALAGEAEAVSTGTGKYFSQPTTGNYLQVRKNYETEIPVRNGTDFDRTRGGGSSTRYGNNSVLPGK
jgi:hypothetical protein